MAIAEEKTEILPEKQGQAFSDTSVKGMWLSR